MKSPDIILNVDVLLWRISKNDDSEAFRLLFERFYVPLCLYAKRYIDDKSIREDIVQDVFSAIWEKRKSIILNISAKNYLISCVKNNSLNYLRKQGYLREYQNEFIEKAPIYTENVDELYNLKELEDLLAQILEKLPEEYRLAFIMNRFGDKSTTEIAAIMHVSVRTVERYRNRALEILRDELKDYLSPSHLHGKTGADPKVT
ncbi:RNA polymerase sigma-70 factor [Betaproteobacteria bacterium]|nr:RNA polymerase sigma-70 factor [Betaproteobacteria bacterium]